MSIVQPPWLLIELALSYLCSMPEIIITATFMTHVVTNAFRSHRPVEELSVNWKRNGVRITSGLHSFGRHLTISNPTSADTGVYVCEATLGGSPLELARANAFLSIIGNAQPAGVQPAPLVAMCMDTPHTQHSNTYIAPTLFLTQQMETKLSLSSKSILFFFSKNINPLNPKS